MVAQDILVNNDQTENKVGQLLVDAKESYENKTPLSIKETQLLNVIGGAMRELVLRFENYVKNTDERLKLLEVVSNGSN